MMVAREVLSMQCVKCMGRDLRQGSKFVAIIAQLATKIAKAGIPATQTLSPKRESPPPGLCRPGGNPRHPDHRGQ
ncbi:hypothetical protein E2C01_090333 [Portunus trituberculatus]|uniref:Uncharacterized protein n=1 Tax=Portunus trituberculatus TaxID=210409 RepID=A0A5B7JPU4_PORTR|nr:hypothetical protein [Portunus trituberculatus]